MTMHDHMLHMLATLACQLARFNLNRILMGYTGLGVCCRNSPPQIHLQHATSYGMSGRTFHNVLCMLIASIHRHCQAVIKACGHNRY